MTHQRIFTPELGEQVLKTLGRYAKLPSKGIVAGQSVASAIDEVFGGAKPVYNDIDIFLDEHAWEARWPGSRAAREKRMHDAEGRYTGEQRGMLSEEVIFKDQVAVHGSEYEQCAWLTHRHLYSIKESASEGLLNHVCVNWSGSAAYTLGTLDEETRAYQESDWLTKVFDLNCTQAAVDLTTGRLHVSEHFEQYYRSRQLQVVTGFTPVHSLLRYFKKRKELGAYGDDAAHIELARRLVQHNQGDASTVQVRQRAFREGRVLIARQEIEQQRERNRAYDGHDVVNYWARAGQGQDLPLSFGRKYLDLYVKHQKVLNDHFMLSRHSRKDLWLFSSKHDKRGQQTFEYSLSPLTVAVRFAESRQAPSKLAAAQAAGLEQLVAALESGIQQEALRMADANIGLEFRKGMEDANLRQRWLEVVPLHGEIFWPILGLTFREQLALIRKLRTEFKKLGMRDPWATIQGYNSSQVRQLLENEHTWAEFMEEHAGTLEPLCEPMPMPAAVGAVQVRELRTSRDLRFEGTVQRHCVGGYASSVRNGSCRIVSFAAGDSSDMHSTAEWRIQPKYEATGLTDEAELVGISLYCNQHRGFANQNVLPELDEAEQDLRAQMEAWIAQNLEAAMQVFALPKLRTAYHQASKGRAVLVDDDGDIPF